MTWIRNNKPLSSCVLVTKPAIPAIPSKDTLGFGLDAWGVSAWGSPSWIKKSKVALSWLLKSKPNGTWILTAKPKSPAIPSSDILGWGLDAWGISAWGSPSWVKTAKPVGVYVIVTKLNHNWNLVIKPVLRPFTGLGYGAGEWGLSEWGSPAWVRRNLLNNLFTLLSKPITGGFYIEGWFNDTFGWFSDEYTQRDLAVTAWAN